MFKYFDWIAHHAETRGHRTALIDVASGRHLTYAAMDERVDRLASHLAGLGVQKGDRIVVLAHNAVETLEVQFATFRLGALFVPLNMRLTANELEFIVSDAGPSIILCDEEMKPRAIDIQQRCGIAHVVSFGAPYETAITAASRLSRHVSVELGEVSTIMYTSGTTGQPKGVMITHLMNFIICVNTGIPSFITPETVFLCVLPLFHAGGLNCHTNPVLHAGGTVLVMRAFDPGLCLRLLSDASFGITHFVGAPAIYQFMSEHPDFAAADLSRLAIAGVGGAPMPMPLLETWQRRGCALIQGFGMTETSPTVLALEADEASSKPGSCGKPLLHCEVRLVGQNGQDVAPGEKGELWVRGPNVTPGYWNRPAATAAAFTDGWLHTGDIMRKDEDGYYYIVDRAKDMYISGGENVYPAEVEYVLQQFAPISEVAVIAVPDDRWGETGLAIVVLKPNTDASETDIITHCRERLSHFKCPRGVAFVDALPRNATGKIHKPALRAEYVTQEINNV